MADIYSTAHTNIAKKNFSFFKQETYFYQKFHPSLPLTHMVPRRGIIQAFFFRSVSYLTLAARGCYENCISPTMNYSTLGLMLKKIHQFSEICLLVIIVYKIVTLTIILTICSREFTQQFVYQCPSERKQQHKILKSLIAKFLLANVNMPDSDSSTELILSSNCNEQSNLGTLFVLGSKLTFHYSDEPVFN